MGKLVLRIVLLGISNAKIVTYIKEIVSKLFI